MKLSIIFPYNITNIIISFMIIYCTVAIDYKCQPYPNSNLNIYKFNCTNKHNTLNCATQFPSANILVGICNYNNMITNVFYNNANLSCKFDDYPNDSLSRWFCKLKHFNYTDNDAYLDIMMSNNKYQMYAFYVSCVMVILLLIGMGITIKHIYDYIKHKNTHM
jgi:hypothetical protein